MPRIFLDHQSTAAVLPEVLEAMLPSFRENFGHPGSLHEHGLKAREVMATARARCASMIHGESPDQILFTSGATESANLAIKGTAWANPRHGRHIVLSAVEHPALVNSAEWLQQQGYQISRVPVDAMGWIDPADVRAAITEQTVLVCVQHANLDLGIIQPIAEIGAVTRERSIPLFVDASASAGWLPIDVESMGAQLLSFSPHRFGGPKGVGILYRHRRARLAPLIHGGVQEFGLRAGTENVPAIVGAGVAAGLALRDLSRRTARAAILQRRLWDGLKRGIEHLRLNGPEPGHRRLPNHLNVSFEFVEAEGLVLWLDLQGISAHSGPSCVSKSMKIPPALSAIGLDPDLAKGAVLFSLGPENNETEMDLAAEKIAAGVDRLRSMSPGWEDFRAGRITALTGRRET